jgi:nitrogen regulatory protein PII
VEKNGRYSCRNNLIIEKKELLDNNKRVNNNVVGRVGQKYQAVFAPVEEYASQLLRRNEINCVVLTTLVQTTVSEIAQYLELMKMFTVGSNKFNEAMTDVKDLRLKLK